ncbi:hypothetical protein GCM10023084_20000 [Streptomyces lacrimifluminis]|uniref:Uncharacterized protein n=1 Tax=Streptomyces lacrimifluminis TaxID=1500077 RepID=A0A917KG52_9ACTN|nr:hypothetical protein [Streptomyces lacrimifluminis]GGJ11018.1 hypothetical protein GCM10012282_04370 [Streptomyces lacrimifluminis]
MNRGPARLGDLLRTARALGVSDPDGLTTLAAALGVALPSADHTPSPRADTPSDSPARRGADPARPSRGEGTAARASRSRNGTGSSDRAHGGSAPSGPAEENAAAAGPYHRASRPPASPPEEVPGPDTRSATGGSLLLVRAARPTPGREAEGWWRETDPSGPPDDGTEELLGHTEAFDVPWPTALPRPAPPWNPQTERAVFLAMAGTHTTGRAVDHLRLVDLFVRSLAGGRLARPRVPYRQRTTTRAGALLLIDRGESMRPFRHDQEWITRLAARILPAGGLRVLDLRIAQGVSRDRGRTWEPHPVSPYGQPVLLLSDLGHLQPPSPGRHHSSPASWLPYLRRLREAGSPVVCLTPYPAEEYPAAVRQTVALVPLDRRVSVRLAQTAARQDPRRAGRRR